MTQGSRTKRACMAGTGGRVKGIQLRREGESQSVVACWLSSIWGLPGGSLGLYRLTHSHLKIRGHP
jgi:hypothetical protein